LSPIPVVVLTGYAQGIHGCAGYARTSGYLKAWRFDIGAPSQERRNAGEIDTPRSITAAQARADLATAQANCNSRRSSQAQRGLVKTRSVSTQERDNAAAHWAATRHSPINEGNVARLEQLQSLRGHAPFAD